MTYHKDCTGDSFNCQCLGCVAFRAKPQPPIVCECGHLTDERMGYAPDAKAARENMGPHHTPIRCAMYRRESERIDNPPARTREEDERTSLVYEIVGNKL